MNGQHPGNSAGYTGSPITSMGGVGMPQATTESLISRELQRLISNIAEVEQMVNHIELRLQPVMIPSPVSPLPLYHNPQPNQPLQPVMIPSPVSPVNSSIKGDKPQTGVLVADAVSSSADRALAVLERLSGIIGQLAI